MIWKKSPLVKFYILVVFLNTLSADHKYLVRDCENLLFSIQTQLPGKPKSFSQFFFVFKNFHEILKIFFKKIIVIAVIFRKLQTLKILVRPFPKKGLFRTSFHTQHVKGAQRLVKYA